MPKAKSSIAGRGDGSLAGSRVAFAARGLESHPTCGCDLAHHDAGLRHAATGIDDDLHHGFGLAGMNQEADGFDVSIFREDQREG